ncbi:hypothetical protein [Undibacterium sp. CCC3.4]|uniref:hypothetical protein n=1 Tax=Undibacterium sp. CCC3.4 TaxID=3048609 RepID=UPI002AC9B269|nr:hypothetical protein [Undibacterium sp. CCC3.4]WPX42036.1 hypothetical protein RHM61_11515 [Undibacterium sp. CCC3.4]
MSTCIAHKEKKSSLRTIFSLQAPCAYLRTVDDARRYNKLVFRLIAAFVFSDPSALEGVKKIVPADDFQPSSSVRILAHGG